MGDHTNTRRDDAPSQRYYLWTGVPTRSNAASQFITGKGGIISEVEQWGKRKLAYPIKHFMEGSYVLIRLKLNPLSNKELEANLQLSEMILRYLLIKIE